MSLSTYKMAVFSLRDLSLFALSKFLIERAAELKPSRETEVPISDSLQQIMIKIPSIFANELMRVTTGILNNIHRPDCLQLVSHPGCDRIVISGEGGESALYMLTHIGSLTKLESLRFEKRNCRMSVFVYLGFYCDFTTVDPAVAMQSLKNLSVIHLPYLCTTKALLTISSTCQLLVELNIQYSKINVGAIKLLIRCPKLMYLNVDDIGYSEYVAPYAAFLLQYLPDLKSMAKCDVGNILKVMRDRAINLPENCFDREYKLETVFLGSKYKICDFSTFQKLFPHVKEINSQLKLDRDLRHLRNFIHLTSVLLINEISDDLLTLFENCSSKFEHVALCKTKNLSEIFQTCSFIKLRTLTLNSCDGVDLELITKKAPNMKNFTMLNCVTSKVNSFENIKGFENLRTLNVKLTNLSRAEIHFLLEHCVELSEITLDSVSIFERFQNVQRPLSDELFCKLMDSSRKMSLEYVKFKNNAAITPFPNLKYLFDHFETITYIELCSSQWKPDNSDRRAALQSISNLFQSDIKHRSITVKMEPFHYISKNNAVENNPFLLKSLEYLSPNRTLYNDFDMYQNLMV